MGQIFKVVFEISSIIENFAHNCKQLAFAGMLTLSTFMISDNI